MRWEGEAPAEQYVYSDVSGVMNKSSSGAKYVTPMGFSFFIIEIFYKYDVPLGLKNNS